MIVWKAGSRWTLLILGSLIGAGYASGQEIWQFFGLDSGLAILLFTLMFMLSTYVVLKISYEVRADHFVPVLERLVGPWLAKVYDILIVLYLFTTTTVMIAGGGVTLEMYHVPFWVGIGAFCLFSFMIFFWDVKGLLSVNAFIIPILVAGLIYAFVFYYMNNDHMWRIDFGQQYNWPASIVFASLNILSVVAVLSSVGKEMKGLGEAKVASILSGLIFGVISYVYNEILVDISGSLSAEGIPLFTVLEGAPTSLFVFMTIVLCLAIYTTTAAGLFGLSSRMLSFVRMPRWFIVFIMLLLMAPLTSLGFADLIAFLYPIYSLLNLYLLVCLMLYPILSKKIFFRSKNYTDKIK
ncbi:hypothetical protein JKL50_12500 [Bacillus altitudinis]|uniref:YkvI family membrane protein n=1 Tax=Bacillus TaxID=1386 RepID=UPI0010751950|nr:MULTISPECIES: hypothetical protein [Bacillus]QQX13263.1 hypothetical protein JKL50_12500 [Bacillus altitudinis]TFW49871.1 hypothetical protein ES896_05400 [Bacillus sp. 005/A4HT-01/001]